MPLILPLLSPGYSAAAGGPFDPISLFSNGEDGFVVEPSPTTSFTTADDTTPAADDDLVQFQKGGTGLRTLSQATAGQRPEFTVFGSFDRLRFTAGNDTRLLTADYQAMSGTDGFSVFARVAPSAILGEIHLISADQSSQPRLFQFRFNNSALEIIGFDASEAPVIAQESGTISQSVWYNVCGIFNTTNARIWRETTDTTKAMNDADALATTTNTAGTVSTLTQQVVLGNHERGTNDGLSGSFGFALLINRSLTEAERNNLSDYVDAL